MRQWSMHSVATTTNAVDAVDVGSSVTGRDLRASASVPRRTVIVIAGQDADGGGHIGIAVVEGTGASVVYFGPRARSTVATARLSLTRTVPLGSDVRSSLACASPFGPYRISATFGVLRLEGSLATLPMTNPRSSRLRATDPASPSRVEAL